MSDDRIVHPLNATERDRSPMNLSGLHHPESPDFILDEVRSRYLAIVRAKTLGSKDVRIDCQAVMLPSPAGMEVGMLLMMSISSPIVGDRIQTSSAISNFEPKDDILGAVAEDLYNRLMDARAQMMRADKPAAGGLQIPGR